MTAKTVVDVILGEAKAGSYQDMLAIASVISNRASGANTNWQDVVSRTSEFNAYGKRLPKDVNKYRSLAQKAIDQVKKSGPVHNATFYATPKAQRNLPKGLKKVSSTDGHIYFTDPQQRPIYTSSGLKKIDYQKVNSAPVQAPAPKGLAALVPSQHSYANQKAIRNQEITPSLKNDIQAATEYVYGPGARAVTYSGGQPKIGTSSRRTGSTRHDGGNASDTYFYNADGERLTGDSLAPIAQHWLANNKGGVGLEMAGGGVHLDNHKNRAPTWSYGSQTPAQRKAIQAGLRGEQSPFAASVVPVPQPRYVAPSNLPAAPRGTVQRQNLGPTTRPREEADPKARALQVAYQAKRAPKPQAPVYTPKASDYANYQMNVKQPAAPAYTPKASDYSNYMMNVKQPTNPVNTPATPTQPVTNPYSFSPVKQPTELIPQAPEKPSIFDRARSKVGSRIRQNLKPQTIAARGAGMFAGGLIGGPIGAQFGAEFGPRIAQALNRRGFGNILAGFNQNQVPIPTNRYMGSSSSRWGSAQNRGATYNASDGATITGLGNGTYARTNPKTGRQSYWNSDGSRSTKGY